MNNGLPGYGITKHGLRVTSGLYWLPLKPRLRWCWESMRWHPPAQLPWERYNKAHALADTINRQIRIRYVGAHQ